MEMRDDKTNTQEIAEEKYFWYHVATQKWQALDCNPPGEYTETLEKKLTQSQIAATLQRVKNYCENHACGYSEENENFEPRLKDFRP